MLFPSKINFSIRKNVVLPSEIQPPPKKEEAETKEPEVLKTQTETRPAKHETTAQHEMTEAPDDEHVTEEMKLSSSSSASSLTDSEIELSDELTEVSSTGMCRTGDILKRGSGRGWVSREDSV